MKKVEFLKGFEGESECAANEDGKRAAGGGKAKRGRRKVGFVDNGVWVSGLC